MTTKTEQIRDLNDRLRQNFSEGTAILTCGIAALGAEAVARIVKTIAVYDDFCHANDPHQEHASPVIRRMQQTDLSPSV